MRRSMLIAVTLAAVAIVGGVLAAVADKPQDVTQSDTGVMAHT
jgi:hypothetical protein